MHTDQKSFQKDVTQQIYQRNLELLTERRHAEDLLYNVSEGVLSLDKDFRITIFNNRLNLMLNIPERATLGKHIDDVIKLETEKGEKIDIKPYCFLPPQKMPVLSDLVLKGPGIDYFVKVKFSYIKSEKNESDSECLLTISDITEEKKLDKAKDEFLSLASHELRTPLTIVKSFLWMMQNEKTGALTDKQAYYIKGAYTNTENMISLVNDMLNIARLKQGRLVFVPKTGEILKTVLESVEGFNLTAKEKNISFEIESSHLPKDSTAFFDESKVRECLINLVGNAIKFTLTGGVKVVLEDIGTHIKISVVDTGVGISNKDGAKLFKKFSQIEKSYKDANIQGGTGLGLYIVKVFAEGMGGQTGFVSNGDKKGSTFWFTVPKTEPKIKSE